jgi:integrase
MNYRVYFSDSSLTSSAGFGKVAHLPCIFDMRPGYHRLGSAYLIDKGLGVWDSRNPESASLPLRVPPSRISMKSYAHWLSNFLEWADVRGVDLVTCNYVEHVQGRYQSEMQTGTWSQSAQALSAATINVRVQVAIDFLLWMFHKGHRGSFRVPHHVVQIKTGSATNSHGHKTKNVLARNGKVRQNKSRLRMPSDQEVAAWLSKIYSKFGQTKGLMAETILLTAVRREEVSAWRLNTLPENPATWQINNCEKPVELQCVKVDIKFGAKGTDYGLDCADKIGPERSIWIPLQLAQRLHEYRKKNRMVSAAKWAKSAPTIAKKKERMASSVHLFLDEKTGKRITARQLYDAWTGVELPFQGWSPHLGRDWWACSTLIRELKKNEYLMSLGTQVPIDLLHSTAVSVISLLIQPQLGHAHPNTSLIYVQWAIDMLSEGLAIKYEADLEKTL